MFVFWFIDFCSSNQCCLWPMSSRFVFFFTCVHSSHTWCLYLSTKAFGPHSPRGPSYRHTSYGKTAQPISHPNYRRAWPPRSNPPPLTSPSPRRRGSCTSAHGDRRKHCTVTVGPLPCSSSYPFRRLSVRGDGAWVDEAKMCSTKWLDAGACAGGWQEWTNPQVIRLKHLESLTTSIC
jgi:hypothetical protein